MLQSNNTTTVGKEKSDGIKKLSEIMNKRVRYKARRNSAEEEFSEPGLPNEADDAATEMDLETVVEIIDEELMIVEEVVIDLDDRVAEIEQILDELGALDAVTSDSVDDTRLMSKPRNNHSCCDCNGGRKTRQMSGYTTRKISLDLYDGDE